MPASIQATVQRNKVPDSQVHCIDDSVLGSLIEPLFARITEISTLPQVALRTLQLADDPESTAADMANVIQSDPAFAARVLRVVNSSSFGIRGGVASLNQAVVLLGFREMRNLALTTHVASLFRKTTGHGHYRRRHLWLHMVSVAVVARHIATTCRTVPAEEVYLAGLLHDVGTILLDQALHRPFCQVLDALEPNDVVTDVENSILGFDHTALGRHALTAWGLPGEICDAAAYHHRPLACPSDDRALLYTVALANSMCHRMGIHSLGVATKQDLPREVFETLGLKKSHVSQMVEDLPTQLTTASEIAMLSLN
jgi:HD-like signal output (HDOD) protein